jgi:hypothetical protein
MSALTIDYLTTKQIDITSIISSFEILKSKIPNVFKTTKDIDIFIVADETDGISDYKGILHKFQAEINIFLIHTEDHSIKELVFKIIDLTSNMFEFVKCIELEYNDCLDRNVNDIARLSKAKKNSPENADIMKNLIIDEYARHEAYMLECVNNRRIQLKKLMIFIENYIIKLNPGQLQTNTNHSFYS